MRPYDEQRLLSGFATMTHESRRSEVSRQRSAEPLRIQKANGKGYRQTRKNYQETEAYVHLTMDERRQAVTGIAKLVSDWGVVRLFTECIDKLRFDPARTNRTVHEPAFERVVSRFERYLQRNQSDYGLLIHDNNQTVAKKHTERMKAFLQKGTLWPHIEHAIETPISVDSQLTNMVPLAGLCAYASRRYLENAQERLFDLIFRRADRVGETAVGVRHFTSPGCSCKICESHVFSA